jgi:LDH2 family malate/lactate/ureidoglycolate dehydrogenase
METAIAKARKAGVGFVSVLNSCHFGAAGYYAYKATQQNMIGLAMANDTPSVTAPGSREPVFGSNPFAFAAPTGNQRPILLDIATAAVAGGKVYMAHVLGKSIPANWIVDRDGVPTTDTSLFPHAASLVPMAGHKGYGLAFLIETLAGLLAGGGVTHQIKSWMFHDLSCPTGHCHAFIALDINAMLPLESFQERINDLVREIHRVPKAKGAKRVYVPGEIEWDNFEAARRAGIPLAPDVVEKLMSVVRDLDMKRPKWLRGTEPRAQHSKR